MTSFVFAIVIVVAWICCYDILCICRWSKPVTAPFAPLGVSAVSLVIPPNEGTPTIPNYFAGSINFAANQVAFHNIGGKPFIVTYTVDAIAKSLNNTIK